MEGWRLHFRIHGKKMCMLLLKQDFLKVQNFELWNMDGIEFQNRSQKWGSQTSYVQLITTDQCQTLRHNFPSKRSFLSHHVCFAKSVFYTPPPRSFHDCALKHFKRKCVFQPSIFRGCVSFHGRYIFRWSKTSLIVDLHTCLKQAPSDQTKWEELCLTKTNFQLLMNT